MFCKNCGNQMEEGDRFCGGCGQPTDGGSSNNNIIKTVNSGDLIKLIKTYFTKPLSFFSEFKDKDVVKPSIILLVVLPIIYGIINIIYTSSVISAIFSMFKKLPDILAKAGLISQLELAQAKSEILMSDEVLSFKSKIDALIDNKDIFLKAAGQLLIIIIVTAIILLILNIVILKNKIRTEDILFIAVMSYIPLVLSGALASLATMISIFLGMFIVFSGYILSFITLFSGISQVSEETNDKVFILMSIIFILISIILSLYVTKYIESSFLQIKNMIDSVGSFL
ncbi:zinc ribbon domain-containing protein [Clostridium sp. UBA1652]|uniref:zinc ribbon domain-containing protein n=1 Tax=Clostridium sp. UBA1652 TaxID=1946348 RepID=UPI00258020FD|nr:zinc ribbon domain-containing protein [Clostridium sp. UBA1652]